MTKKDLKFFIINYINQNEQENENYIRYSYYELKVKKDLMKKKLMKF